MNIRRVKLLPHTVAGFALSFCSSSYALEPAKLDVLGVPIVPVLGFEQRYDDNLFSQDSNTTETWVTEIKPSFEANLETGDALYALGYSLSAAFHENSSDDDYVDNYLYGSADWELNQSHALGVSGSMFKTHEARGTGFSQDNPFVSDSPDRYLENTVALNYALGAESSKGRLNSKLEYYDKRYTNHRDITSSRDRSTFTLEETFLWRVGGKTDALIEFQYDKVDYDNDPANVSGIADTLDNDRIKLLTGVTWQATGKTEGQIKVGYVDKTFDDSDRDDFDGLSWDLSVSWSPKSYSTFTLSSGRRQDESSGTGDFIDGQDFGLSWDHEWNDRFNTELETNFSVEDYKGDPAGQEDDLFDAGLKANYQMRRWLEIGISYLYEERDSNQEDQDYSRNIVGFHIEASL